MKWKNVKFLFSTLKETTQRAEWHLLFIIIIMQPRAKRITKVIIPLNWDIVRCTLHQKYTFNNIRGRRRFMFRPAALKHLPNSNHYTMVQKHPFNKNGPKHAINIRVDFFFWIWLSWYTTTLGWNRPNGFWVI